MVKFRFQRGLLSDSMKTVVEVADLSELLAVVQESFPIASDSNIAIAKYYYDGRIGWDTHIVCIDCNGIGFTDGPVKGWTD